jgi:hypothetical protein
MGELIELTSRPTIWLGLLIPRAGTTWKARAMSPLWHGFRLIWLGSKISGASAAQWQTSFFPIRAGTETACASFGRIQRQIRRALIAAGGMPVRTGHLLRWCYPYVNQFEWRHRSSMHRAAHRFAVNIKVGLWGPNAELLARIRGATDRAPVGLRSETSDYIHS